MIIDEVKAGMIFKDQDVMVEIVGVTPSVVKFIVIESKQSFMQTNDKTLSMHLTQMAEILDAMNEKENNVTFLGFKEDHPEYFL